MFRVDPSKINVILSIVYQIIKSQKIGGTAIWNILYRRSSSIGFIVNVKERKARPTKTKRMKKRKNPKNSVPASVMHAKMPYIWRFLDNKTRRKMINLARKPIKEINIKTFVK